MDVLRYAKNIYQDELQTNPNLESKYQVIVFAAVLHDMCDHKYLVKDYGIIRIKKLLELDLYLDSKTIDLVCKIISTMSYSKVKLNGLAKFDNQLTQLAYNIVREADLLTAYDFDRSIVYAMSNKSAIWNEALKETQEYFMNRVLKQISDGLFVTKYGLTKAIQLHNLALTQIYL